MINKSKIFAIALIGLFVLTVFSCQKASDKIEESLGVVYAVDVDGHTAWDSNTSGASVSATMDGSRLKITIKDATKEVVLYAKEFVKGKYIFDTQRHVNTGVYKEGSKTFKAATRGSNYVEILYIHTDAKTFDGSFSFVCTEGNETKTVHGSWANVKR